MFLGEDAVARLVGPLGIDARTLPREAALGPRLANLVRAATAAAGGSARLCDPSSLSPPAHRAATRLDRYSVRLGSGWQHPRPVHSQCPQCQVEDDRVQKVPEEMRAERNQWTRCLVDRPKKQGNREDTRGQEQCRRVSPMCGLMIDA